MSFPIPETKGVKKNDQSFKIIVHSNVFTSDINQNKLKHAFKTEKFLFFFLKSKEKKASLKIKDKTEMRIQEMDFFKAVL